MRRIGVMLATTGLALTALAGCSGDQEYCDAVEAASKEKLLEINEFSDTAVVTQAEKHAQRVIKVAPDDIKPAWGAFKEGIRASAEAKKMAGGAGGEIDTAQLQKSMLKLQAMQRAVDAIRKDVDERCG